jgi:hypothetical protein
MAVVQANFGWSAIIGRHGCILASLLHDFEDCHNTCHFVIEVFNSLQHCQLCPPSPTAIQNNRWIKFNSQSTSQRMLRQIMKPPIDRISCHVSLVSEFPQL